MNSREIREQFLAFFEARQHRRVPSSPLVPADDPTLLFTNAGMNQFKNVFLGVETRPYTRATSCQKCMRAGGKHNDLENVGHTPRHHTFFEMLGNFSFGDYFKKEAITWAWELVTEVYGLPPERIWISIYREDDESHEIWTRDVGVPAERVVRLGEEDNFWAMGETGPCGPCSELHYDLGPAAGCGKPDCAPGCECGRFLEFWNLVFMQYNRNEKGELEPLPHPSIDTGMGLERMASILQGSFDNYHTDLFLPIMEVVGDLLGVEYPTGEASDVAVRVIADHARAVAFLLAEGVLPSNDGRGYVLRKIIRRALRYGQFAGRREPYLYRVALFVVDMMKDIYPELEMGRDLIRNGCYAEEERFFRVIETGLNKLDVLMRDHAEARVIPGEEVFKLYDTFGLPLDLVEEIARERGFRIDMDGYHRRMREQQERARKAWKGEEAFEGVEVYRELSRKYEVTFHGYEHLKWEGARVLAILDEARNPVNELKAGERGEVILDETVFYGESGGQVGDIGVFHTEHATAQVEDTKIYFMKLIVHHVRVQEGVLRVGDEVSMEVPRERREATMRHHTGTHLLHAALREVLGLHVKQAGSLVAPDRLRFDFTHFSSVSRDELDAIERMVNAKIYENVPVQIEYMPLEDAIRAGALAFFGDKYGDVVRVIQVGDFSKELCGGTHVRFTGDIGPFMITRETSVAAGVRRIEAVCGAYAVNQFQRHRALLEEAAGLLKSPERELLQRITDLQERLRQLQKDYERLRRSKLDGESNLLFQKDEEMNGLMIYVRAYQDVGMDDLRHLADRLRSGRPAIVLLGSRQADRVFLILAVHKTLTDRVRANELIRDIASLIGGGGGGRPDFAQAGGRRVEGLQEALERGRTRIRERVVSTGASV